MFKSNREDSFRVQVVRCLILTTAQKTSAYLTDNNINNKYFTQIFHEFTREKIILYVGGWVNYGEGAWVSS